MSWTALRTQKTMSEKSNKGVLARGLIQCSGEHGSISVNYEEHGSRDGRLLVAVDGHLLDARQLRSVADALTSSEENLSKMRKRYAGLLLAHLSLLDADESADRQKG